MMWLIAEHTPGDWNAVANGADMGKVFAGAALLCIIVYLLIGGGKKK